jgi:hypothetical protein
MDFGMIGMLDCPMIFFFMYFQHSNVAVRCCFDRKFHRMSAYDSAIPIALASPTSGKCGLKFSRFQFPELSPILRNGLNIQFSVLTPRGDINRIPELELIAYV